MTAQDNNRQLGQIASAEACVCSKSSGTALHMRAAQWQILSIANKVSHMTYDCCMMRTICIWRDQCTRTLGPGARGLSSYTVQFPLPCILPEQVVLLSRHHHSGTSNYVGLDRINKVLNAR